MAQALAEQSTEEAEWVPEDNFGARLALIRQHKSWNVKEAAQYCGISPASWRNWEEGVRPQGLDVVAQKIARAAGCNYRWLMMGGTSTSSWLSHLRSLPVLAGQMEFDLRTRSNQPERPALVPSFG
jgi:transcriptional regulator with XRE-family HTH domain